MAEPTELPRALSNLGRRAPKQRIPLVRQMSQTECGAACLSMVLAYHGKRVPLDEIRRLTGAGRDASDAATLLKTGESYGLAGRALALELGGVKFLEPGSILHWEFQHFVVFERLASDGVHILDPAQGRRRISLERFAKSFTGLALSFARTDRFAPGGNVNRRLWRYLSEILHQGGALTRILVLSVLVQVLALSLPVFTGAVVDRVVPRGDYHLLTLLGLGLAVLVAFNAIAGLIRGYLLLYMQTRLDAGFTLRFLGHLVSLPYSFFQQRSPGDLMMRMNSNTVVREILTSGTMSGLLDGSIVLLYLVFLLAANPSMGLLVFALAVIRMGTFFFIVRRQRELLAESLETQALSQDYQVEMLASMENLKSMGLERRAVERWSNLFVDSLNVSISRGTLNLGFETVMTSLGMLSPLLLLGYGAWLVMSGALSLGSMLALTALAGAVLGPVTKLVTTVSQLQLLGTYLDRLNDVLDTAPEQDATKVTPAPRLSGRLRVERASFRYSPISPLVVEDVVAEVAPGQTVAIVGPSGSGKSTLARLLVGLYAPTSGRILYDGVDLTTIEGISLRAQLGIVTQSVQLFGGTIRDNIALLNPALPLEAVIEAARSACIHDDIVAMPMGYDTILSHGGLSLSGGQRQRIALARALVNRPSILLLDEATSALDAVTERRIQENLDELRCTRIVIAHRLSTIMRANLILVMDQGRMVEHGAHAELLAQGRLYARLVAAQRESAA